MTGSRGVIARRVVIGIGNPYRNDDGVAAAVLAALRRHGPVEVRYVELDGEATRLIDVWDGAELALVVDACRSGGSPGQVHRIDADAGWSAPSPTALSGHATGIADAVLLATALGRMPRRLRIVAVEVADLGVGTTLSPPVSAAVPIAMQAVLLELERPD